MTRYEYKVIPAPRRAERIKGADGLEDRFAQTLAGEMNTLGADGWEFWRSETLEAEDRRMLGKNRTAEVTVLVFRRPLPAAIEEPPHSPALGPASAPGASAMPPLGPATDRGPDAA
jgi:hypothetical protein